MQATTHFTTPNASKYLQQLCKHFAHKIEATYDAAKGHCDFDSFTADLEASDSGLGIIIQSAEEEGITRGKAVIWNHLERFAFREAPTEPEWKRV